jgi:hypothetical protein
MAEVALANARANIEMFAIVENRCPATQDELIERGYLRRRLVDPWHQSLFFRCEGERDIEVVSAGPDRAFNTTDDLSSRTLAF